MLLATGAHPRLRTAEKYDNQDYLLLCVGVGIIYLKGRLP